MDMICIKCRNKAVVSLKHMGSFCSNCFLSTIEKRIRKDLSIHKVFTPHESVLVLNDRSLKAKLAIHFLNNIAKSIPLKIDIINAGNTLPRKRYDKIVTPDNLDDDVSLFVESIFKTGKPVYNLKEVHLLRTVSDEELILIAKQLKLKALLKKSKLGIVLSRLESNYPGSKFGLLNSIGELQ